jgi:hypothetical protein
MLLFPVAQKILPTVPATGQEILHGFGIGLRPRASADEVDHHIAGPDQGVELLHQIGVRVFELLLVNRIHRHPLEPLGQLRAVTPEFSRDRGEEEVMGVESRHELS